MDYVESAKSLIAEAKGDLMTELQSDDIGNHFPSVQFSRPEWAEEMMSAYFHLSEAIRAIERAQDFE